MTWLGYERAGLQFLGDREFLGTRDGWSSSGAPVTVQTAVSLPAFRQGITLISADVAKCPIEPYRIIKRTGEKRKATSHPAYNLVARFPHEEYGAFEFWRRMMLHALIYSHAYAIIETDANGNRSLMHVCSNQIGWNHEVDGYQVWTTDHQIRTFTKSQILHVRGLTLDGYDLQLLRDVQDSLGLGLASLSFASKFFRRGGRIGGILELPASMSKTAKDRVEEGFRKSYENDDSAFATVVLRDSAKFHEGMFAPLQSQLVETRQEQVREVARILNLPAHKLGDATRVSYNSLESEERSYVNSTLSGWFHQIESECDLKLLTQKERETGSHCFRFDYSELVATDAATKNNIIISRFQNNIIDRNEARMALGYDPVEQTEEQPEPGTEDAQEAFEAAEADANSRIAALVNREAKRKRANRFADWVDGPAEDEITTIWEQRAGAAGRIVDAAPIDYVQQLRHLLETTTADTLQAEIKTLTEQWKHGTKN